MAVSLLCIVHCIATPAILFFIPAASTAFIPDEDLTHKILFVLVLAVALFSFIPGYRLHRRFAPMFLFAVGLGGLITAAFIAHKSGGCCHHDDTHSLEPYFAIPGSVFIVLAHYFNHRSCKHACVRHETS